MHKYPSHAISRPVSFEKARLGGVVSGKAGGTGDGDFHSMEGVNKVRGPDGVVESGIASKVLDDEAKWACGFSNQGTNLW